MRRAREEVTIREGRTYMFCRHCYFMNPKDPEAYALY